MGSFWSRVFGDKNNKIIKGVLPRIENISVHNFRGLLGVIVPILVLTWQPEKDVHHLTVQVMWMWMFWFWLIQPVAVPVTAMIPIFILPMCGVMSTMATCACYFNEGVVLFILGSMLLLLLNNSGFDRRLALDFLTYGGTCQFSGKSLVFKCCTAAYILSMFSDRLIVTSTITQYVTPIFLNMERSYGISETGPDFTEMRYILNNAIQTSSAIGSLAIVHASYVILLFRAVWLESTFDQKTEYPDIFNYLQYSAYAFPVTFIMYLFNLCYHMVLIYFFTGEPMETGPMNDLRKQMLQLRDTIPERMTTHEKLSVFFTFFSLLILFLRWNKYQDMGWADYNLLPDAPQVPLIKDACVVAMFVIVLHSLPRSLNFLQIFTVDKKSELKNLRTESSILWWRFVDKNTNYGYFFVFGAAIAINQAVQSSGLGEIIANNGGKEFTEQPWCTGLFSICLVACVMANGMTECASLACVLPFVINMSVSPAPSPWQTKLYIAALGVSVGSSLGFMLPFLYTPAYFCHHTGKVPILRMVYYNFLCVWGCLGILWFSLCYWAPYLWDPNDLGILSVPKPQIGSGAGTETTTEEAPAPPPPER